MSTVEVAYVPAFQRLNQGTPRPLALRLNLPHYRRMTVDLYLVERIMPKEDGLKKLDFGQCAIRSDGVL